MSSLRHATKSEPFIPLSGHAKDGYSYENEATATCFCGAVQLAFPLKPPGLVEGGNHYCHCYDCHKIHSSMLGANFTVVDKYLKHLRGEDGMTKYSITETTTTGNTMVNSFCKICGTLMYRRGTGFPDMSILRVGTVDDFNLMETVLKPDVEQFVEDRVRHLKPAEGVEQLEGFAYAEEAKAALKELREREATSKA